MRVLATIVMCAWFVAVAHADERSDALAKAEASVAAAAPAAAADPTRPIAHVLPPAYWTNDPNGPLLLNGTYHLFSQHNPYGKNWGHMHWAHYTSADLVHWKHEPIALWPSLAQGEEHCFSGSAIVGPDGLPRIFYTSIGPKTNAGTAAVQWMAVGDKTGMTWEKWDKNPVMTLALHGDTKVTDWRDPYVWKEGSEYRCVLGGESEGKGVALIYSSPDLEAWTYKGILCSEPEAGRKGSWECPNFFKLGDKWVLIISRDGVRYFTGTFDEKTWTFTPEKSGTVDLEPRFYAPNGLVDAQGRHLLWGWVTGVGGEQWNCSLTFPRVLGLGKDGALLSTPLPELSALRGKEITDRRAMLAPSCELEITVPQSTDAGGGVHVSNGKDELSFGVSFKSGELILGPKRYPLGAQDGPVTLRVFIDRSVIEVYTSDGRALTLAWPGNGASALTLKPYGLEKPQLPEVKAWELRSIWQ